MSTDATSASKPFWSRSLLNQSFSELIGSLLFTFVGISAIAVTGNIDAEALTSTRIVSIALLDGFLYYLLINLTMRLSDLDGGYCNPTITFSLALMDTIFAWKDLGAYFFRAFILIAMQIGGACLGALLVLVCIPNPLNGSEKLGFSHPTFGTSSLSAFLIEAILGFFLTMVILGTRRHETRRSSILIAFSYVSIRLLSYPLSGGFVNPARSFGPSIMSIDGLKNIWIYLIASPLGALVAVPSFLYLHKEIQVDSDLQADDDA